MKSRALAGVAIVLLAGCTGGSDAVDQSAGGFRYKSQTVKGKLIDAADRKKAGKVSGDLLEGGTYTLASDAGKVVVVNFWGAWCDPCKGETPQFDSVYRATKDQGVNFVGMDVKESSKDGPRAFVHDNDISYPIVYDEKAKTALQLGNLPAVGLPLTVLIDKQQRVAAVYVGVVQPADLKPAIATLVAEQ